MTPEEIKLFDGKPVELHYIMPMGEGIKAISGRLEVRGNIIYLCKLEGDKSRCFKARCHFKLEQVRFVSIVELTL